MPATPATAPQEQRWPGERLGLPETGPRSIGRLGRRILAIIIDWSLAVLISTAFFGYDPWALPGEAGLTHFAPLFVFAITQILFLTVANGSVGHLITGMRVVPVAGGWVGWWRPWVRTLLLCLIIPAVIWDRDQRGLHDLAAGTVLVRR